jgi:ParB family chromosome partitioning protein
MKIESKKQIVLHYVPLHSLRPYEKNAKKHPVTQLQGISESISNFGFKQPIVIDKNNVIVAGHGRYEAAASLGISELPCIIADDLTDKQIRAYRLLDNKLAESGMDLDILSLELSDLDFDFAPYGVFTDKIEFKSSLETEDESPEKKIISCPECGHEFIK